MVINMFFGVQRRVDELRDDFHKLIENRKTNQSQFTEESQFIQLQTTTTEVKNTLEAIKSGLEGAEGWISNVKDRVAESARAQQYSAAQSVSQERQANESWDTKCPNTCIIGILGEEREKGTEKLLEDIIAENSPDPRKETDIQVGPENTES